MQIEQLGKAFHREDGPLIEYMERLFSEGQYFETFVFSQNAVRQCPDNLRLILFRSCSYIMLVMNGDTSLDEELLSDTLDQLGMICELLEQNGQPDDALLFFMSLGCLALGRFQRAEKLWQSINKKARKSTEEMYQAYMEHWKQKWPGYDNLPQNLPPS